MSLGASLTGGRRPSDSPRASFRYNHVPDYEPDYHDDAPNSRVLPHSAEAEEGLISCCLIDGGQALQKAQEAGIRGDLFYAPGNSIIFSLLSAMKAEL